MAGVGRDLRSEIGWCERDGIAQESSRESRQMRSSPGAQRKIQLATALEST